MYAMCDPFYMVILSRNLGTDYIVVDQGASIKFLRPGIGKLRAHFYISPQEIETIKNKLAKIKKSTEEYTTHILDDQNRPVAEVHKQIYVRKRGRLR